MNPEDILTAGDTLKKIETVCRRHFSDENERNECYIYVVDSLEANDYKRLRAYSGKSSMGTFIYTITNRLIIDFKRMKYGRRRMPVRISRLGEWAESVYRYVCWEKFSFDDAFDFIKIEGLFKGTYETYLKEIDPIRKVPCPRNIYFVSENDVFDTESKTRDGDLNPLERLIEKLDEQKRKTAVSVIRDLTQTLPPEDRLLIKLVYGSDISVPKAAKIVGIKAARARKNLKKIFMKFQEKLLAEGIRKS